MLLFLPYQMRVPVHPEEAAAVSLSSCTGDCCEHGTPAVLADERERILAATGIDTFVEWQDTGLYIIGKLADGSDRDLARDACPYFTEERRCALQEQDPGLKPRDCYIHPLFLAPDGGLAVCTNCCDAYKNLSSVFIQEARAIAQTIPREQRHLIYELNLAVGFELKQME
jgi:hypothetical protein